MNRKSYPQLVIIKYRRQIYLSRVPPVKKGSAKSIERSRGYTILLVRIADETAAAAFPINNS